MNIVYLDAYTANPGDLSWDALGQLGNLTTFDHSTNEEAIERARDADILIVNKFRINERNLANFTKLKYIVVSATGYNNIALDATQKAGIPVSNVRGYSTSAVAQHVFSALFSLYNRTEYYNYKVRKGAWNESRDFCFYDHSIEEVADKTIGIIGYGTIGQRVAQIAEAFGMNVKVFNKYGTGRQLSEAIKETDLDDIFQNCDVISLHAPLNDSTNKMINSQSLGKMKPNAILINTSRGGLIDEAALARHLQAQPSFFALLDVLSIEPPTDLNLLVNQENCLLTPHLAWASKQARQKLLTGLTENIQAFIGGELINSVS